MSITPRVRLFRTPAALLCACTLLTACQDAATPFDPAPAAASSGDPLAQRIAEMGFRADMIVDAGDHFVVEGDILIRKADLAGAPRLNVAPAGGPSFHYHTGTLVPQSMMAQGIPVSLSGITSNSAWTTAARSAIAAWNNSAGTKIKFVEVTSGAYINFSFGSSSATTTIAQGGYPVNGYPGGAIIINPYHNSISATRKLNAMVHELGHTIGHRHTDYATADPPGGTAVWIPGTPTGADAASVMHSVNKNWNGFTMNDITANQHLYPAPAPVVTTTTVNGSGYPYFAWTAVTDASSYEVTAVEYRYEWLMDDWNGDPVYGWTGYAARAWVVSGTSFTSPHLATADESTCSMSYAVSAVYPNGRRGEAAGMLQTFGC